MLYRHLNTGAEAEIISQTETNVSLKLIETGEYKNIKPATFKRWWKKVPEAEVTDSDVAENDEPESVEAEEPEVEASENELETRENESEEAKPEDMPAETEGAPESDSEPAKDEGKVLALSEIVSKLENLFSLLNNLYFEGKLPQPIITVQSTPKAYGHCSTKKIWKKGEDGKDGGQYEINIGAEFLNRPSEFTAATMLHEMIHLYCRENDIEETCQNGRYHNKRFKEECESRGLVVEYDRTNGYSTTLPSKEFAETLRTNGYVLEVPFARHTLVKEKKKAERTKVHKYVCPKCGQSVSTTQNLSLICGNCNEVMTYFGD